MVTRWRKLFDRLSEVFSLLLVISHKIRGPSNSKKGAVQDAGRIAAAQASYDRPVYRQKGFYMLSLLPDLRSRCVAVQITSKRSANAYAVSHHAFKCNASTLAE